MYESDLTSVPNNQPHDSNQNHSDDDENELCLELEPSSDQSMQMVRNMHAMRVDGILCDIVLQVKEKRFVAHRVVMSSCSRWLAALLFENEHLEVVPLGDTIDPEAFEAVLRFMYGQPFKYMIKDFDKVMHIIRTFELETMERDCWDFLMEHTDERNCHEMHKLADRFDCDALKSYAWIFILKSNPEYSIQPQEINCAEDSNRLEGKSRTKLPDSSDDSESSDGEDDSQAEYSTKEMGEPDNDQPSDAARVVNEWKMKLQRVWEQCQPEADIDQYLHEEEEEEEEAFDYPRYLFAFYKRYNPEAIERIDAILKQYAGNYDAMLIRLFEKYDLSLEGLPTESARNLAFQDDSD